MEGDESSDEFKEENQEKEMQKNKILITEAPFQNFLAKATKIVILFLKDKNASQELARSVL